ncbi:MAG: S8/S53 family peptidase [Acidobacteriaceae bacterium]|nr:S8/S53 family peptidase [Acidobacteriaceae bacterium]
MFRNLLRTLAMSVFMYSLLGTLAAQPSRIRSHADVTTRALLQGHVHPLTRVATDQGRLDPATQIRAVTLVLRPSASQQADLEQLLASQQDARSPDYHHWLTPEQYADRFGVSASDVEQIKGWLEQQGLSVGNVARARNFVSFSGTAAQIETAFNTRLDSFDLNGEVHFANVSDPAVPAAFAPVISSIRGLNDFRPKARSRMMPKYTSSRGNHYLAPDDLALIYDIKPLYDSGIDGTGQSLVVVGQTALRMTDISQFRSYFNLPANTPQVTLVPNSFDPGIRRSDLSEADLDIEISGAVARNATILYVYADNVMDALQYAIDQNMAPVLSMSYGSCEQETSSSDAQTMRSWAQQANAQGMTWFAASGDSGGADCYGTGPGSQGIGLAVDLPAGIPEVTGVGGTEFAEGSGTYWNAANGTNSSSVVSYIPEVAWNDSAQDGSPSASGGGASIFFSKPSWQAGNGVPSDGKRDVPDVAWAASADHDGVLAYYNGSLSAFGGTSAGAPSFAGIATLLNHYLVSNGLQASAGLGNINPGLYSMAKNASGVFHDIVSGNNEVTVTCSGFHQRGSTCSSAGTYGFSAAPGYDQVTGWGSVDVFNLITQWSNGSAIPSGN